MSFEGKPLEVEQPGLTFNRVQVRLTGNENNKNFEQFYKTFLLTFFTDCINKKVILSFLMLPPLRWNFYILNSSNTDI